MKQITLDQAAEFETRPGRQMKSADAIEKSVAELMNGKEAED